MSQHHHFVNFSNKDGLSQNVVHCIEEDFSGHLWFGTRGGGLNKFDGKTFEPVTTFDGLSHNGILSIKPVDDGSIWVGTDDGLNLITGDTILQYFPQDRSKPFVVSNIFIFNDEITVGSTHGLFTVGEDNLIPLSIQVSFDYLNFVSADGNSLWMGIGNEVLYYKNKQLKRYSSKTGLGTSRTSCATINEGNLIVAHVAQGVFIGNNSGFRNLIEGDLINNAIINDMIVVSDSMLWLGTQNDGIFLYNLKSGNLSQITTYDGLANNHVDCLEEDSWGNVWIGTGGSGISKHMRTAFSQLNRRNGLPDDWIYSTLVDRTGKLWVGAGLRGVSVLTDTTSMNFSGTNGFVDAKVRLIYEDRNNRIWLCPEGYGLWYYDSTFHRVLSDIPDVRFQHIKAIAQDTAGHFWVCEGGKGLFKIRIDSTGVSTIQRYSTEDGLPRDYIYALHVDHLNRIWFGSKNRGAGYIQEGKVHVLTVKDGLASNSIIMMSEDDNGYLWMAGGDGLSRITLFDPELPIAKYGYKEGIEGNPLYQVHADRSGYLWVGTARGVTRFDRNRGELSNPKHYGIEEGFTGLETNANAISSSTLSGKVYIGTGEGLMVYGGDVENKRSIPPKLSFQSIRLFYEDIRQTSYGKLFTVNYTMLGPVSLSHDQNHLSFYFKGIAHDDPNSIKYSWKLENFDRDWTPAQDLNSATYSNLPPGSYVFHVRASKGDGNWSAPISTSKFNIPAPPPPPPPFWKQTWFVISACVILMVVIGLLMLNWYTRITKEQERIKLERNVLEIEQKALRLQMNPHFIFNTLNTIQSLITRDEPKEARRQLAKFSKLMRQILDNSRSQLISVEEEVKTLETYLAIEQSTSSLKFTFSTEIAENIVPEIVGIPPLMLQPFTENSIIHGFKGIDRPPHLEIKFWKEGEFLICTIADNGIGRKAASKQTHQKESQHKSTALIVTQERLDILHGKSKEKHLAIEDIISSDGSVTGTRVIITLPYTEL